MGGVFRYWISIFIYLFLGRGLPYGTLVVNISGSFLMGLFTVILQQRFNALDLPLRALLLVGFLGGYTTFSSFSMDTLNLFESGRYIYAALNILGNVLLCLLSVCLGVLLGRQL